MKDNPYSKMLDIMSSRGGKNNPPSVEIATVTQEPPSLMVKIRELEIDNDNLLIADYLLENHSRKISFQDGSPTGATLVSGDHSHGLASVGVETEIYTKCTLKKGDIVAVLPTADKQLFIILARLSEVI